MLDAACAEFAALGPHGASVDRIAAAAATTKATVYARFGSKAGLLEAAWEREAGALRERLLSAYAADGDLHWGERLHRYVGAYFRFAADRPDGFRLLFRQRGEAAGIGPLEARITDEITERIAELVAGHLGEAEPGERHRLVAALVVGATHHGAGAMAAQGVPVADAAAITERFLVGALRGM
jgi:AcrR family transcriptional regulator